MKSVSCILISFLMAACGSAELPGATASSAAIACKFTFDKPGPCAYKNAGHDVQVQIETTPVGDNELALSRLAISHNGHASSLAISSDTTLIDGDTGFISFADINFDSIPDLAITTSFGVANLYMDYWVYQPRTHKYVAVGNLPRFEINKKTKTLSAEVKSNAAHYKKKTWVWQGDSLIEVDK